MLTRKRWIAMLLSFGVLMHVLPPMAYGEENSDLSALVREEDVYSAYDETAQVIDLSKAQGETLTLTEGGDFLLSGQWDGQLVIDAPEQTVRLILDGVEITSPSGPALVEKQADKLIITLAEGSENTLIAGEAITEGDDALGAALYAEDDLSINGSGALTAVSEEKHGMQTKADLIIAGGKITVDAASDGIRARNSVLILDGTITIHAGGDGIVSTRANKEGKGWVRIAGGNISIQTGDGAGEPQISSKGMDGRRGWAQQSIASENTVSQKGVKAATEVCVLGGSMTLDTQEDGLHGASVTVSGGALNIRSGDDGIHADGETVISGGYIVVAQSYEGIEGANVTISGGEITVVASDDGVNASGASESNDAWGGRFQEGDNGALLTISGGWLQVNAGGDGLDSNGSIALSGGVTGVWSATSMGEGAIDFNGSGEISGGVLILASAGGVMQDTARLTGASLMAIPVQQGKAGEEIVVLDGSGEVMGSFTPIQAYDTLLIAGNDLAVGMQATVTAGGQTLFDGEMTSAMAEASNVSEGFGRGFRGGRGMMQEGGMQENFGGWGGRRGL